MELSSIVKELYVGEEAVILHMQNQAPVIEYQMQVFNHLWMLCQQCPALCGSAYLKEFAEISNFLWKGLSFQIIDNIAEFQKNYIAQIAWEKSNPTDVLPYRLTDYQIFDVSVMHDPNVIDNQLHFFVYNRSTGLPYRVVCPFPYTSLSTLVHYQILPLKKA